MLQKSIFFVYKTTIYAILCIFFLCVIVASFFYFRQKSFEARIYPNIFVDNVYFGGKYTEEVKAYFDNKNSSLSSATITLQYKDDQIATFSGAMLGLKYDSQEIARQAYSIGRTEPYVRKLYEQFITIFRLKTYNLESHIAYSKEPTEEFLTMLDQTYSKPPLDALFRYENNRVTVFRLEKDGIEVDIKKAQTEIETALEKASIEKSQIINIVEKISSPQVTISSINDFGIVEKIGEGRSDYTGSIPGRVHNVKLAASKFDGVLIPQGEVFSFNATIGDISSTTGYQQAYIIKNGRTVLGDGGGVCQVSTTLFRAALDTGLPIVARKAHAYRVHYYENDRTPGFDATVFSPSTDFKFKNDTPAYILIQMELDPTKNTLVYTFYGKKDGRVSTVSDATIWDIQPPPAALRQDDPTLKKGVVKQVDWSAPGTKSKFHYNVVRGDEVLIDQDFYSNFRPWQAIFLVGTAD